jgi:hypothetical protein
MGVRTRGSCGELFKVLKILPVTSQYIFSLALFVVNNKSLYMENSQLHYMKTGNNPNLFQPSSYLTILRKYHIVLASRYKTSFPLKQRIYHVLLRNLEHFLIISYNWINFMS